VGNKLEEEFRSQESGVRSQESGVRSQKSGVRSQESEVRSQQKDECKNLLHPKSEYIVKKVTYFSSVNPYSATSNYLTNIKKPLAKG